VSRHNHQARAASWRAELAAGIPAPRRIPARDGRLEARGRARDGSVRS
jgi:hypothetical protein